jgi:hypothetical protein
MWIVEVEMRRPASVIRLYSCAMSLEQRFSVRVVCRGGVLSNCLSRLRRE